MTTDNMFKTPRWLSDEAEAILANEENMAAAKGVMAWLQKYMPNHFPKPAPFLHIEMLAISMFSKNAAIAAPRSHSKSTLLSFGLVMYRIVFLHKKYIIVASESLDKAEKFVTRLRDELEFNRELIQDHYASGYKTTDWAKGAFVTRTRIKVEAIGYGQSGRGLVFEESRPDLVVYDDLETTENAGDQTMKDKFLSDLFPAIARNNPNAQRCYVGTIINKDSLLYETIKDTAMWTSARYEAVKENGDMIAPMLYSKDDYIADKASFQRKNKLSIFYAENHNNPLINDIDSTFKQEYFKYFDNDVSSKDNIDRNKRYTILYDPAMPPSGRTRVKAVDRSAIVVVGTDTKKNWYVVEIHANRDAPSKNRDLLFTLAKKYNAKVYMETIAAQRGMYLEIIEEMKRRDERFTIREIPSHSTKKEARIEQLQPLYEQGIVYHNSKDVNTSLLEEELLLFGNTAHDDVSDCLSFGIGRLSYPKYAYDKSDNQKRDRYANVFDRAFGNSETVSWRVV